MPRSVRGRRSPVRLRPHPLPLPALRPIDRWTLLADPGPGHGPSGPDVEPEEFLTLVAHDIRSPLSAIRGFADLLRRRWDRLDDAQKLEHLEAISGQSARIMRLVDDLLAAAALESGAVPHEVGPLDLEELARRVADDVTAAEGRVVRVSAAERVPPALGDPGRCWQILHNLMSNAVKFSPAGSPVEIAVRPHRRMVTVSVRDHGRGIHPEALPTIFRKFSRLAGARGVGHGLGLYISRLLAEVQGGWLRAESEPGRGSVFTLALPARRGDRSSATRPGTHRSRGRMSSPASG